MPVVKTPRAIIDIIDAQGAVTGHEIEYHYTWEGGGDEAKLFTPRVMRDEATPEEVALLRKASADTLTASHQALNAQIAVMQEEKAALVTEKAQNLAEAEAAREAALAQAKQTRDAEIARIKGEHDAALAELQAERNEAVAIAQAERDAAQAALQAELDKAAAVGEVKVDAP